MDPVGRGLEHLYKGSRTRRQTSMLSGALGGHAVWTVDSLRAPVKQHKVSQASPRPETYQLVTRAKSKLYNIPTSVREGVLWF